ncbi:hypothetical protein ACS0PU_004766 [Formica fusca]
MLKESTVTGTVSNRKKKSKNIDPRPPLDPTKLKAIRATVKHYLITQYDLDEISIDFELQQLGSHIAHKICELNRNPKFTGLRIKTTSLCTTEILNENNIFAEVQSDTNISDNSETLHDVSQESNAEKENEEKNNEEKGDEENDEKESNDTNHDTDESDTN